ncbi:hypothetical protein EDD18DRAFT_1102764 [Armillaria luteobubalina]|uniref:Uncharacterized protein n=1 Tax=Armillaria luteobubalina TaxID=153913 RepID=A0AA39QCM2_9AGAR|nr:hypothetical protein EDD18DRAFT_1102764 [Armillaria luteobubalina]
MSHHMLCKFQMMDGEDDSEGDKRGCQDDEDVFQGATNDWANEVERDVGERSITLLREQIEDTIAAARHFARNRGRADEGDLAELAQMLIAELTMFMSPEKACSTEVMIWQVYSKQEKMERKMEVFESMQAKLDKRERKSNERQMKEVHTSIHIPDYVAVTASLPRGGTHDPSTSAPGPCEGDETEQTAPTDHYNHATAKSKQGLQPMSHGGCEDVEVYPDEKWYSVHICGARTGIINGPDGDGICTANEVRHELMAKNPTRVSEDKQPEHYAGYDPRGSYWRK